MAQMCDDPNHHLFDDRFDVFIGGTHLLTLPRGRAHANGKHDQSSTITTSFIPCANSRWRFWASSMLILVTWPTSPNIRPKPKVLSVFRPGKELVAIPVLPKYAG